LNDRFAAKAADRQWQLSGTSIPSFDDRQRSFIIGSIVPVAVWGAFRLSDRKAGD
jgi:hypothetical protein